MHVSDGICLFGHNGRRRSHDKHSSVQQRLEMGRERERRGGGGGGGAGGEGREGQGEGGREGQGGGEQL